MRSCPNHSFVKAIVACLGLAGCALPSVEDSPKDTTSVGSLDPSPGSTSPGTSAPAETKMPDATHDTPKDPDLAPTYENFGDAFLRNWCKGCHSPHLAKGARFGAPVGVDLWTLEDLREWQDRVRARATGPTPSMPPAGGPSQDARERLARWLDAGAP